MTLLPPPSLHRHRLQMLEHRPRAAGVGVGVVWNVLAQVHFADDAASSAARATRALCA